MEEAIKTGEDEKVVKKSTKAAKVEGDVLKVKKRRTIHTVPNRIFMIPREAFKRIVSEKLKSGQGVVYKKVHTFPKITHKAFDKLQQYAESCACELLSNANNMVVGFDMMTVTAKHLQMIKNMKSIGRS